MVPKHPLPLAAADLRDRLQRELVAREVEPN
ncbi:hypothetical protein Syncc8109_2326 [Synechococcus sp. WH 8109]|nr:hypothetical protein Syncc8109_2326 [Synechococcus sp. WH 8109]